MSTTNAANTSALPPPPEVKYPDDPTALRMFYFRQSSDGVNFTVTPVYLGATDGMAAVRANPWEYSATIAGFTAWKGGYNNSAAVVGGRGRIQGAHSATG